MQSTGTTPCTVEIASLDGCDSDQRGACEFAEYAMSNITTKLDAREATPGHADDGAPASPVRLAELQDKLREKLWTLPGLSADHLESAVNEALDVYDALGPQNIEEELVAERLVLARASANVCQKAAYSFMHRAEGARLSNLYRLYSDDELKWKREWDKGRGRADQVVRVVNVKDGGQAMIGNVHVNPKGAAQPSRPTADIAPLPPGVRPPSRKRASKSRAQQR